jgi:hypothetical protein
LDIIKLLLTRPTFLLGEYENRTDVNKRLMPRTDIHRRNQARFKRRAPSCD